MQIDVWSDFACPWCALGLRRLHVAREQLTFGDDISVVHHAFELDPQAPARRAQNMNEMLATKYGMSPEQVRAGHDRLGTLGHEVGLTFNFDRIQLGNTFDAHRLASAARGTAVEGAVVESLFAAYFADGELLSDHQALLRVATKAGMDPDVVSRTLASDAYEKDVRADEALAHDLGITGVPHFIIDGKWAIPGAQDVETMVLALNRVWELTGGAEGEGAQREEATATAPTT